MKVATWDDAVTYCLSQGSHLASISTKAENDYLKDQLSPLKGRVNDYWMGFNDLGKKGIFRWEDGSPVTLINWATDNPVKDAEGPYRYTRCFVMLSQYSP